MTKNLLTVSLILLFSCQSQSEKSTGSEEPQQAEVKQDAVVKEVSESDLVGTWKFVYPRSNPKLKEDHYLVIERGNDDQLIGYYYGTTDDFDIGREGYLPGFFMTKMTNISFNEGTLEFTLSVREDQLYETPIPPDVKSAEEINANKWEYGLTIKEREYKGTYKNGSLVFDIYSFRSREFKKQ